VNIARLSGYYDGRGCGGGSSPGKNVVRRKNGHFKAKNGEHVNIGEGCLAPERGYKNFLSMQKIFNRASQGVLTFTNLHSFTASERIHEVFVKNVVLMTLLVN
jgi:hypothetical protein